MGDVPNTPFQGYQSLYPLSVEDQEALLKLIDDDHDYHPTQPVPKHTFGWPGFPPPNAGFETNVNTLPSQTDGIMMPHYPNLAHSTISRMSTVNHEVTTQAPEPAPSPADTSAPTTLAPRFGPMPVPGDFECLVRGCEKVYRSLTRLKSHQQRYHKGSLFCLQRRCTDRTDFATVTDLLIHARSAHLTPELFWCHLCYCANQMAPGQIKRHLMQLHHTEDLDTNMLRIHAEFQSRQGNSYGLIGFSL